MENKFNDKRRRRNFERKLNKAKIKMMKAVSVEMRKLLENTDFMDKVANEIKELKTPEDFKNYKERAFDLSKNEM